MATETLKTLAQSRPSATTLTDAYTCGASGGAVVRSVEICNTSATADTCRISHAQSGAVDATSQYKIYGLVIPGNATLQLDVHWFLANTDKVRTYAVNGTLNFHFGGMELT